jgi:hypothetical protein
MSGNKSTLSMTMTMMDKVTNQTKDKLRNQLYTQHNLEHSTDLEQVAEDEV